MLGEWPFLLGLDEAKVGGLLFTSLVKFIRHQMCVYLIRVMVLKDQGLLSQWLARQLSPLNHLLLNSLFLFFAKLRDVFGTGARAAWPGHWGAQALDEVLIIVCLPFVKFRVRSEAEWLRAEWLGAGTRAVQLGLSEAQSLDDVMIIICLSKALPDPCLKYILVAMHTSMVLIFSSKLPISFLRPTDLKSMAPVSLSSTVPFCFDLSCYVWTLRVSRSSPSFASNLDFSSLSLSACPGANAVL